jgi:hypothetical protein
VILKEFKQAYGALLVGVEAVKFPEWNEGFNRKVQLRDITAQTSDHGCLTGFFLDGGSDYVWGKYNVRVL